MKLPYIKAYKDRHGRARYYFRRKGFPSVQLPPPNSPGFMAAYEAASSANKQTFDTSKIGFLHGSLGWLIDQFVATKAFNDRAPNTWRSDRRIFDELKQRFGAGMLRDLRPKHVKAIRDHFHRLHSACRDPWATAGFLGMTVRVLEQTYGHHHPDYQKDAADI